MDLMTVDEFAKMTHCSASAVRQRIQKGLLPAAKLGKRWFIRKKDIDTIFDDAARRQRISRSSLPKITRWQRPFELERCDFMVRVNSILERHDIRTIDDLCSCSPADLLCLKNFGRVCLIDTRKKFADAGFHLKGDEKWFASYRSDGRYSNAFA